MTITKEAGGIIDIENDNFQKAAKSLMEANPKFSEGAVLSFTGTRQGIEEKIDKLIKEGADSALFNSIRTEVDELEKSLTEQLSTNSGIEKLIRKKVINDLIGEPPRGKPHGS